MAAVRAPSVVASSASVLVVYALGRLTMDRTAAVIAGVFFAINATAIHFGQEARAFALVTLLNGLALLALAASLREIAARRTVSHGWPALFVLASIGSFWLHYTSLLFIAACFMALGLHLLTTRPFPLRQAIVWVGAGLAIALGIAYPLMIALSLSGSSNIAWIQPLSAPAVAVFFRELLSHPENFIATFSVITSAAALLILTLGAARPRLDRLSFGILILIPALFILILIVVSIWRPMLITRIGAWLSLPICLLLARAATWPRSLVLRAIAAGLIGLMLLLNIVHYRRNYERENWALAVKLAATEPQCSGPVLFNATNGTSLLYYQPHLMERPIYMILSERSAETAELVLTRTLMKPTMIQDTDVSAFAHTHPGSTLILRGDIIWDGPPSLIALLTQASFHATLPANVRVYCY